MSKRAFKSDSFFVAKKTIKKAERLRMKFSEKLDTKNVPQLPQSPFSKSTRLNPFPSQSRTKRKGFDKAF